MYLSLECTSGFSMREASATPPAEFKNTRPGVW